MSVRSVGRAAAGMTIVIMAVLSTLVVMLALAHRFASPWPVLGVALLMLVPWGALTSALLIRERSGAVQS